MDTNFVNAWGTPVLPNTVAHLLISTAQHRIGVNGTGKPRRIWFEAAAERIFSDLHKDVNGSSQHDDAASRVLQRGALAALEYGATGIGVTNLRNLGHLATILPRQMLVPGAWAPTALLVLNYESFYAYRRCVRAQHAAPRHTHNQCPRPPPMIAPQRTTLSHSRAVLLQVG